MTRVYLDINGHRVPEGSPEARSEWDDDDPAFLARNPQPEQAPEPAPEPAPAVGPEREPEIQPEPPASRKRS